MLIYLDVCCFNRPFDDQAQLLIHLQTKAKLFVQQGILEKKFDLVWSAILDLENNANPDEQRRLVIADWQNFAKFDIAATVEVETLAHEIEKLGIKAMDALHVASAINANADYFLTTDKAVLRKLKSYSHIKVMDPVDFLRALEGDA